jgi:hypothetical protein
MELIFPSDLAPQCLSWMQKLQTQGAWALWMRQLDKDLGPIKVPQDSLMAETELGLIYQRVLDWINAAIAQNPQGLAACLYQTDVPEHWLHQQPFSAEPLAKVVLARTLQKVVFRIQYAHPA